MNYRDFVVPALLSFATVFIVNYFISSRQEEQVSSLRPGQKGTAPESFEDAKPLQTNIDFDDNTLIGERTSRNIETSLGSYHFTNATGGLSSLQFIHPTDQDTLISTLGVTENEWEQYAFLTAIDMKTPFYYTADDYEDRDDSVVITYRGESEMARIAKTYTIDKRTHRIDLDLHVEPLTQDGCMPRIFIPSPYMYEIAENDAIRLIAYEEDSVKKYGKSDAHNQFWKSPTLFGGENRYFIHALVQDRDNFVKRAYARLGGEHTITPILEGPHITQAQTWRMAFYCGPKEAEALDAVDERLEAALDYGWLTPVSKFMLWLLKWIYDYVKNYGWAIIILTVVMRLLLFPFAMQSEGPSQAKSGEFERKKKALEKKYQNDQETLAREQYRLAKEYGKIPSVMGCLPMLLQIPVFIGLNYALRSSIVLYKAPFIGWIQDLSAPDPYYVLPVVIGGSLFVNALSSQQRQQQMVFGLLAIVLIGVTANLPAGLALYIAASTMLGVLQTTITRKLRT